MTDGALRQLAALFRETGMSHHRAFAATNGEDPDWPAWYAEFLAPRLPAIMGRPFMVGEVADLLRQWDREHSTSHAHESWPEYYARSLLTLRNPGN